jgi:chromosome segregation ATPase
MDIIKKIIVSSSPPEVNTETLWLDLNNKALMLYEDSWVKIADADISNTAAILGSIKEVLDEITGKEDSVVNNINAIVDIKTDIQSAIESKGVAVNDDFSCYAELIRSITILSPEDDDYADTIQQLQSDLDTAKKSISILEAEKVALTSGLNDAQESLNKTTQELNSTQNELSEAKEKITAVEAEKEALSVSNKDLASRVNQLTTENSNLVTELEQSKVDYDEINEELDELQDEYTELQAEKESTIEVLNQIIG